MRIEAELNDEVIDELARAVAERVEACLTSWGTSQGYLDVNGAAEYLSCPKSRIYDLTSRRQLPHYKLGSRLLFSKQEIDAWLLQSKVEAEPTRSFAYTPVGRSAVSSGRQRSAPTASSGSLRALLKEEAKPKKQEPPLPAPLYYDEERKEAVAKALGMTRAEFDQLTPREFERLWDARVARFDALSEEQKEALLDWDPSVDKLGEMPMDEMEALAARLVRLKDE